MLRFNDRFDTPGDMVLRHARTLNIKLTRVGDSAGFGLEFSLEGIIWPADRDDDDDDAGSKDGREKEQDGMDLALRLLDAVERGGKGGTP